jgi:hypothetical protein
MFYFTDKKNAYSAAVRWNVLYMSVRPIWCGVQFNSAISLVIFCLDNLCVADSGILKS